MMRNAVAIVAALVCASAASAQVVPLQDLSPIVRLPAPAHAMQAPQPAAGAAPGQANMGGDHASAPVYYFVRINNLDFGAARGGPQSSWDINARVGTDDYRLVLKSEGEGLRTRTKDAEVQVLFDTPISDFFNFQAGWRRVLLPVNRNFFAIGIEGLAPNFFETEATIFISEKGGASARAKGGFDIPILPGIYTKPSIEVNAYTDKDPELGTYPGLGGVKLALQTRYEITRQFAPYIEIGWERLFGRTSTAAKARADRVENAYAVVGIRLWY